MIRDVIATGAWLQVDGGSSYRPYFNMNSGNPAVGQVRYSGNDQQLQVYDGNSWLNLQSTIACVNTSQAANEVLVWAQKKMAEERDLDALMARHPGLQDLKEKFELMKALCQSEETNKHAG